MAPVLARCLGSQSSCLGIPLPGRFNTRRSEFALGSFSSVEAGPPLAEVMSSGSGGGGEEEEEEKSSSCSI